MLSIPMLLLFITYFKFFDGVCCNFSCLARFKRMEALIYHRFGSQACKLKLLRYIQNYASDVQWQLLELGGIKKLMMFP